jgi:pimeloyl-ACP methyl ester carboxylesterase
LANRKEFEFGRVGTHEKDSAFKVSPEKGRPVNTLRWIFSILLMPFLWGCSAPLVRPDHIDWNPSLSPRTIQVKGHTLFYVVKGEGEPLILIHGYGAGIWVWERQIDFLSRFYRVYALDLIGHGFSDRPRLDYTPEIYIQCLKGFMDEAGIEQATLIGNSMGGGVAWAMALVFPERVKKLVLINSAPPDVLGQVKNESFRTLVAIKDIPILPYLVVASRSKRSIKWLLQECVADIKTITPEVLNRQYQLSRIEGTTWALYSTFKNAGKALTFKDRLGHMRHPTLLLWGKRDLVFPPSVGEDLHREIGNSKLILVEGSGHIPMWETPEAVNPAIVDFLVDKSSESGAKTR